MCYSSSFSDKNGEVQFWILRLWSLVKQKKPLELTSTHYAARWRQTCEADILHSYGICWGAQRLTSIILWWSERSHQSPRHQGLHASQSADELTSGRLATTLCEAIVTKQTRRSALIGAQRNSISRSISEIIIIIITSAYSESASWRKMLWLCTILTYEDASVCNFWHVRAHAWVESLNCFALCEHTMSHVRC